jgi:hypothetical protein
VLSSSCGTVVRLRRARGPNTGAVKSLPGVTKFSRRMWPITLQFAGHRKAFGRTASVRWLRQSSSAWIRRAAAILLICGGLLSFLPILGLWMLPLGLLLLAEDVPPFKFARTRILDWIEHRHPNWLVPERHK